MKSVENDERTLLLLRSRLAWPVVPGLAVDVGHAFARAD